MWMAISQWKKDGTRDAITPSFATGTPSPSCPPSSLSLADLLCSDVRRPQVLGRTREAPRPAER